MAYSAFVDMIKLLHQSRQISLITYHLHNWWYYENQSTRWTLKYYISNLKSTAHFHPKPTPKCHWMNGTRLLTQEQTMMPGSLMTMTSVKLSGISIIISLSPTPCSVNKHATLPLSMCIASLHFSQSDDMSVFPVTLEIEERGGSGLKMLRVWFRITLNQRTGTYSRPLHPAWMGITQCSPVSSRNALTIVFWRDN